MAAKQFILPFIPALDPNALTVPGAQLVFYASGTSTPQAVYADALLTISLGNVVQANSAGIFPDIYLDDTKKYRLVLLDGDGAVMNESDPYVPGVIDGFKGDPGGNVMSVGLFSSLAGMVIPDGVDTVHTSGPGGTWYIAFAGSDALVAKHPFAIAKTANGRYFRLDPEHITLKAFGADPTGSVSAVPALRALIRYCSEPAFYPPWSPYSGGRGAYRINLGVGVYLIDDIINIKGFTAKWIGGSSTAGAYAVGSTTRFKCTFNGRFQLDRGDTGDMSFTNVGADGSIFEGIVFEGSRAGYNLFTAHCTFHFVHTSIIGGGYHGLYVQASSGATDDFKGNANSWSIEGGDFSFNLGSGICCEGADANAGRATNFNCVDNERYGVEDLSFLGNNYSPNNMRSNTLGHFYANNLNGSGAVVAAYTEGGAPATVLPQSWLVVGGTHGTPVSYNTPFIYGRFGVPGGNGYFSERKSSTNPSNLLTVQIGTSYESGIVFSATRSDLVGNRTFRFVGNDFIWGNGTGSVDIDHIVTGVGTTNSLGRSAPVSYGVNIFRRGLSLGSRVWNEGSALPTATDAGSGETVWNIAPTLYGPQCWVFAAGSWRPTGIVGATRATGLSSSSSAAQIVAALQAAGLAV